MNGQDEHGQEHALSRLTSGALNQIDYDVVPRPSHHVDACSSYLTNVWPHRIHAGVCTMPRARTCSTSFAAATSPSHLRVHDHQDRSLLCVGSSVSNRPQLQQSMNGCVDCSLASKHPRLELPYVQAAAGSNSRAWTIATTRTTLGPCLLSVRA